MSCKHHRVVYMERFVKRITGSVHNFVDFLYVMVQHSLNDHREVPDVLFWCMWGADTAVSTTVKVRVSGTKRECFGTQVRLLVVYVVVWVDIWDGQKARDVCIVHF